MKQKTTKFFKNTFNDLHF